MEWLNYHHLFYFWQVVRMGSITRACEELSLAPPTVSAQLRTLENQLGEKLLVRSGRKLVPTDVGQLVFRYAEEIFSLGRELVDAVKQRPTGRPLRLAVGVDDVLPKEIAQALIEPALHLNDTVRLVCREASLERLMAALAVHELDVVLSDAPVTPSLNVRAYSHLLGESGVTWMATPSLAAKYRRGFPKSLNGAPMLLPTDDTAIRRGLDQWCDAEGIRPVLTGEFEDYALLRAFAQRGTGVIPVPSVLEKTFKLQYRFQRIGVSKGVKGRFYAVSIERRIRHPAVMAILNTGRKAVFSEGWMLRLTGR
jgi:LysR family transcriptional regulator, transcriptional activator of nhaA